MNETLLKLADLYLQAREMKSELEARVKAASLTKIEQQIVEQSNYSQQTSEQQRKNQELLRRAITLREEIDISEKLKGTHDILKSRVAEISKILRLPFIEFRGDIFKSLIEKVVVNGKKSLKFIFKCGIERDIEIY